MNIYQHLAARNLRFSLGVTTSETAVYFWLYNLLGQIVGYSRYNPNGIKTASADVANVDKKYYVWLSDLYFAKGNKAALWGWQFYNPKQKYVFLVEGVFDASAVLNCGFYNVFATLGNDPKILRQQLRLLGTTHTIVTICDNDAAGRLLRKYGEINVETPKEYKDLNELECSNSNEVKNILLRFF